MSKATQQTDIRGRLWVAPQLFPSPFYYITKISLAHDWQRPNSQNTQRVPAGVLRGKTNTGRCTPRLELTDIMWKGHRTQPVDLGPTPFQNSLLAFLVIGKSPSFWPVFSPYNYGRHVVQEAEHVQGLPFQPVSFELANLTLVPGGCTWVHANSWSTILL